MPSIVDTLVTRMVLDSGNYASGGQKVLSITSKLGSGIAGLARSMTSLPAIVAGSALVGLGVAASGASADLESLKLGLLAVEGSAEAAGRRFKDIQGLAKLPSLGIEEAAQAYIDLAAAGMDGDLAVRSIQAFGNALATVGKGKEVLANAAYGLRQISTSSTVLAEDLNILKDAVPQVTKILTQLYGTARSEDLAKLVGPEQLVNDLVRELGKLPPVTGGTANAFSNLGDAARAVMAGIGDSINKMVVPALNKVSGFLEYVVSSGYLTQITQGFEGLFGGDLGDTLVNGLAFIAATLKNLPSIVQGVGKAIGSTFEYVTKHASIFAAIMGGIFIGGTIVRGVTILIEAFVALRKAIQTAGIAAVIMEAIASGGASLAKAAIGFAAGAAAAFGIYKSLEAAFGSISLDIGSLPGLGDILKDQKSLLDAMKGGPKAPGASDTTTDPATGDKITANRIASATERTAMAVERSNDIMRLVFGGGAFANQAVSETGVSSLERRMNQRLRMA